jgi:hypothetical protein
MTTPSSHEVTQLLVAWSDGDQAALERLTQLIYRESHRLAKGYLHRERPGYVLQTTASVDEVKRKQPRRSRSRRERREWSLALASPPS